MRMKKYICTLLVPAVPGQRVFKLNCGVLGDLSHLSFLNIHLQDNKIHSLYMDLSFYVQKKVMKQNLYKE